MALLLMAGNLEFRRKGGRQELLLLVLPIYSLGSIIECVYTKFSVLLYNYTDVWETPIQLKIKEYVSYLQRTLFFIAPRTQLTTGAMNSVITQGAMSSY